LRALQKRSKRFAFGAEGEVAFAAALSTGLGRGHTLDAADGQGGDEAVGVVGFVGDQGLRPDFGKERFGPRDSCT
jgi:hypothetical protein